MMIISRLTKFHYLILSAAVAMVWVTGGCSKDSSTTSDLLGNWKVSSEFEGIGRTEAVHFTIGDLEYVGLGYNGTDRLKDFWAFQKSSGTWKRVAEFPGDARNSAVAFVVGGVAYVGSGFNGSTKLSDFWSYNPGTNSWTQIADLADFGGTARYGAVAFSLGNKGYIATGYDGNYLKDLWEYDPSSNTWQQKASLTGAKRTDAAAFVYNNKAYVVTGVSNDSYLTDFYSYDQSTDSWTRLRNINSSNDDEEYDDDYGSNIQRSNAAIFVLNNKAYLCCGEKSGATNTTWEYNIDTDLWAQKTSFEGAARQGAIGFAQGGVGYITTGTAGSSWFDDLWEFYPNAEQTTTDNY
ncbi:Kelch repeat-containing protein [Niabella sp. 22666]|uniref:Kelch repeat-containing protein n=1 Tax=Niabella sp. 22666 TaxID=3453954 RepID=UPI003F856BF5